MLLTYSERFITGRHKERFRGIIGQCTNHFIVAMEDVFQIHNISVVVCTHEVFGVQQAHSIEGRSGKHLDTRIAMDAQKWVGVFCYDNTQRCTNNFRTKDCQIIATTPHKDACSLSDFDISRGSAFFFGAEKEGLSEQVLLQTDTFLKIPMVGFTESPNISIATTVVLQQLADRFRRSDLRWQLTEEECYDTLVHWIEQSIKNVNDVLERYEEVKDMLWKNY